MIRTTRKSVGFRFLPDCPDHVKARTMAKMLRGDDSMPFCDKEWIHPIEETQNGWWIPFIGFVSDARMSDNIKRAKAFMAKAGK